MRGGMDEATAAVKLARTQPPRRGLKFSLMTLLLVVTVCCIWLAVKSNAARRQREGIALIERLGGMHSYNVSPDRVDGIGADLMRAWLGDDYVVHVDSAAIWKGASDDHAAAIVEAFPNLSGLIISGDLSDAALASIGKLRNLKGLTLSAQRISNDGLANLSGCRQLQRLHMLAPVSDEGMVHLTSLSKLTYLRCFLDPASTESSVKLEQQTFLECDLAPLLDVLETQGRMSGMELKLDRPALKVRGIDSETPITASLQKVSLGYALEQVLDPLGLGLQVTPYGALITTKEKLAVNRRHLRELQAALPGLTDVVTDW
jgi:hypothetical protein